MRDAFVDLPTRQRLLQRALDESVGDAYRGNLSIAQQLLEVAAWDRRDLAGRGDEVLDQQDAEKCGKRVSDVEAGLVGRLMTPR